MQTPDRSGLKRGRDEGHGACSIAPSSAARLLFGSPADRVRSRTIWEKVKTKEQCMAVLKDQPKVCWLCGNGIDSTLPSNNPLSIQCEHILPVMQAVIFLQLYSRDHGDNITDPMKMEYAWAHAKCNNIKTNTVFIEETADLNYKVNIDSIRNVLTTISNSKVVPEFDIEDRVSKIQSRIEEIVTYLNKEPGSANLRTLAGIIDCLEEARFPKRGGRKRTRRNKQKRQTRRR